MAGRLVETKKVPRKFFLQNSSFSYCEFVLLLLLVFLKHPRLSVLLVETFSPQVNKLR